MKNKPEVSDSPTPERRSYRHFPHMAEPPRGEIYDATREVLGLDKDAKLDRFDTPAFVGRGQKHARIFFHADENPTREEQDIKDNIRAVDSIKGIRDYDVSPLLRNRTRTENKKDFTMNLNTPSKRNIEEEFLNEFLGGYKDWVSLNLGNMQPDKQKTAPEEKPSSRSFSSTLTGLFGGSVRAAGERKKYATKEDSKASESGKTFVAKKEIDRASNAAQRIQQAAGFTSDASFRKDPRTGLSRAYEIPTYLRNAMVSDVEGASSPTQKAALQQTGWKSKLTGSTYGSVGPIVKGEYDPPENPYHLSVSPEIAAAGKADASRRTAVYKNAPYRAIRGESVEQTEARLLAEVRASVVLKNRKGGSPVGDPTKDVAETIPGLIRNNTPNITVESVNSFVYDLCEAGPTGAMGSQFVGPTTQPPTQDKPEALFNTYYNQGSTQIPFKSPEAQRIKSSVETPTLLRKAMAGDTSAQAAIEKGEKPVQKPSGYHDAYYKTAGHLPSQGYQSKGGTGFGVGTK